MTDTKTLEEDKLIAAQEKAARAAKIARIAARNQAELAEQDAWRAQCIASHKAIGFVPR